MNLDLQNRPTLKKALAALLAAAIAVVGMLVFGGDDEKDRDVLDQLCRFGLNEITVEGGYDLCLKDPDPKEDVGPPAGKKAGRVAANTFFRQDRLCPGDGTGGHRIRVFVGSPADKPVVTPDQVKLVQRQLGFVERTILQSHDTHAQKLNWYCADDTKPTIEPVIFPPIGSDGRFTFADFKTGIEAVSTVQPRTIYHAVLFNVSGAYPYGGQGTTMTCDAAAPSSDCLDKPQFSMTSAYQTTSNFGAIILHELGHNMGAVMPSSHHSTGNGWHCTDQVSHDGSWNEIMCYDDGGSGIVGDNNMAKRCDFIQWKTHKLEPFDCDGDFWDPERSATGYFADHWNLASSPYFTKPRRK